MTEKEVPRGILISYTGQGKGKTTAALGMIFRALGHGHRVGVVQFIKGKWMTGERHFAADLPNLEFHVMGRGFTWDSDDISRDQKSAQLAWQQANKFLTDPSIDLVILDELSYVINYGFISEEDVCAALLARPRHQTVVVTGRNMPPQVSAAADLITEMGKVRHPFDQGERAIKGVDY